MDIRSDRQKGLSYVELGKKYHMDPRTAKRYAESPQKPEYTLSAPKPTKMDPYKQIVDEWLEEAPYSAIRILEKLREMGFNGGYSIVKAYVSSRMSAPMRFCSFSPKGKCQKTPGKGVQSLNNDTCRFRPSSLKCTDKSGLDGLQAGKWNGNQGCIHLYAAL